MNYNSIVRTKSQNCETVRTAARVYWWETVCMSVQKKKFCTDIQTIFRYSIFAEFSLETLAIVSSSSSSSSSSRSRRRRRRRRRRMLCAKMQGCVDLRVCSLEEFCDEDGVLSSFAGIRVFEGDNSDGVLVDFSGVKRVGFTFFVMYEMRRLRVGYSVVERGMCLSVRARFMFWRLKGKLYKMLPW